MLLSQRIKEGVKKYPTQAIKEYFGEGGDTACAMGCAYWSLFKEQWYDGFPAHTLKVNFIHPAMIKEYPYLEDITKHPIRNGHSTMYTIICVLNDDDNWTRMEISKWLESQGR